MCEPVATVGSLLSERFPARENISNGILAKS
jgi:hypothetical protein